MSFASVLRTIVDGCGGGIGAALLGSDGIAIEQVEASALPASFVGDAAGVAEEVAALGVEFGRILDEVRKASDAVAGGRLEELVIGLGRYWLLFRVVDEELFLVSVVDLRGNLGKARFLMRRHLLDLQQAL